MKKTYYYIVTLPDRLYPFRSEIEGQWVRGRRSYQQALEKAARMYGFNHLGYKLMAYRQVCHMVGSVILITAITLLSKELFGSDRALYVLLATAIIALFLQEFYLHPKLYGQKYEKGLIDLAAWLIPIAIYITLFH